jgi:cytochrome b6-f complex iron-sulfur subunit
MPDPTLDPGADEPAPAGGRTAIDRRTLLQFSVHACGVAAVASGGFVVVNFLAPIPEGLGEQEVAIRDEELPPGAAVQVLHKGKPVLIVRDRDGALHALSAVCTHLGCLVKWSAEQQRIECPCHAATFTTDGTVTSGPAPEPLPRLPVGIVDGVIKLEAPS